MKTIILFLFICTFITVIESTGQGFTVDHNNLNIELIPSTVIDDIQQNIRWQYAHTSYGGQLTCGLEQTELSNSLYNVEIGDMVLPVTPDALCIYDGTEGYYAPGVCCQYIEPVGYWLGQGIDWTHACLNHNPTINTSGWSWCDQLDTYTNAEVQVYLDQITLFGQEHPDVTFIFFTGNAQADGAAGYNRHLRCDQIREYCEVNNKILFDFEDLDCWYNGIFSYYIYNGDTIPIQHDAFGGDQCGHVNILSATQKAKAVWWMMAKMTGWQTTSLSLNLKLFLQGNYSDTGMNTNLNLQGVIPLYQPYNTPPNNYNGNESVTAIPNPDIVDWILLEYRDAATAASAYASTSIGEHAAFLRNDGQVLDLDGISNLQFDQTVNQQLFIIVRYRNHLSIMSANGLILDNNVYSYDFTTGSGQVYGGDDCTIEIGTGVWGMISGDGNADGTIDNADKLGIWAPSCGVNGYSAGDFDLNGDVNNQDKNLIWNVNFGKVSLIP
jgi:hypothetical protein